MLPQKRNTASALCSRGGNHSLMSKLTLTLVCGQTVQNHKDGDAALQSLGRHFGGAQIAVAPHLGEARDGAKRISEQGAGQGGMQVLSPLDPVTKQAAIGYVGEMNDALNRHAQHIHKGSIAEKADLLRAPAVAVDVQDCMQRELSCAVVMMTDGTSFVNTMRGAGYKWPQGYAPTVRKGALPACLVNGNHLIVFVYSADCRRMKDTDDVMKESEAPTAACPPLGLPAGALFAQDSGSEAEEGAGSSGSGGVAFESRSRIQERLAAVRSEKEEAYKKHSSALSAQSDCSKAKVAASERVAAALAARDAAAAALQIAYAAATSAGLKVEAERAAAAAAEEAEAAAAAAADKRLKEWGAHKASEEQIMKELSAYDGQCLEQLQILLDKADATHNWAEGEEIEKAMGELEASQKNNDNAAAKRQTTEDKKKSDMLAEFDAALNANPKDRKKLKSLSTQWRSLFNSSIEEAAEEAAKAAAM